MLLKKGELGGMLAVLSCLIQRVGLIEREDDGRSLRSKEIQTQLSVLAGQLFKSNGAGAVVGGGDVEAARDRCGSDNQGVAIEVVIDAYHAGQIMQLPARHYLVRGAGEPELTSTPDYSGPWELLPAMRRATMIEVAPLVNPDVLDDELAWRWQWLEAQRYEEDRRPPLISLGGVAADDHDEDSIPEDHPAPPAPESIGLTFTRAEGDTP